MELDREKDTSGDSWVGSKPLEGSLCEGSFWVYLWRGTSGGKPLEGSFWGDLRRGISGETSGGAGLLCSPTCERPARRQVASASPGPGASPYSSLLQNFPLENPYTRTSPAARPGEVLI